MILEILQYAALFFGGGGTVMLGNYVRSSFGGKAKPPNTSESVEHALTRGYKLLETMGKDVLRLWHPPKEDGSPCDCAYCEIRGDDIEDEKDTAKTERVAEHQALTEKQLAYYEEHRDTPNSCCKRKRPTYGAFDKPWTCPTCGNDWVRKQHQNHTQWHGWVRLSGRYQTDAELAQKSIDQAIDQATGDSRTLQDTQVKNLEDQMSSLAKAVGQKNEKIVELERLTKAQHDKLRETKGLAHMWEHAYRHPGGTFIEGFGVGYIRYDCPEGASCDIIRNPVAVPGADYIDAKASKPLKARCKACGTWHAVPDMVQAYDHTWCITCWERHESLQKGTIAAAQQDIVGADRPLSIETGAGQR